MPAAITDDCFHPRTSDVDISGQYDIENSYDDLYFPNMSIIVNMQRLQEPWTYICYLVTR